MKTIYLQTIDGAVKALGGADSAVLRPGEPVFVPEPVEDWCSFVALAIRISRRARTSSRRLRVNIITSLVPYTCCCHAGPGPSPHCFATVP